MNESKPGQGYKRYVLYLSAFIFVVGLVYFALLADAFYSDGNQPSLPRLMEITPSLPLKTDPQGALTITRPANGMKAASQTIEVEGIGPAKSVIALYLNGTLIAQTVPRKNTYRFSNVLLTKNANVIQTRSYMRNGASNFSPAIMVLFPASIKVNFTNSQYFQNSVENVSRGNPGKKEIILTFNGESEANSCERILYTLNQNRVRSTMFLSEKFMTRFPELTVKIAAEQEVGNLVESPFETREEFQQELRRTEQLYSALTGKRILPLWRAGYEGSNLEFRPWATELRYTHVAWTANPKNMQNMDSLDSVPNQTDVHYFPAQLLKDRVLSFGQNEPDQANGAIVLMHLGSQRRAQDRLEKWLPEIIQTFKQRGYRFITASELIKSHNLTNIAAN